MSVELTEIYRAFSDPTRLRILNLLLQRELCVCHIQEALNLPQVNTSQHLAYLRKIGLVECERVQTWKVYRLKHSRERNAQLNLKCLGECVKSDPVFAADASRLQKVLKRSRSRRIDIFCNLPFDKLDWLRLKHATKEIGKTETKDLTRP